jgi:hypothetical protein
LCWIHFIFVQNSFPNIARKSLFHSQIDENESLVKKDFLLNNKRTLVTAAIKNWIEKNKLNQIRIIEETRTVGVREWIVYLLIICGVFGAEWILRKRWGMES